MRAGQALQLIGALTGHPEFGTMVTSSPQFQAAVEAAKRGADFPYDTALQTQKGQQELAKTGYQGQIDITKSGYETQNRAVWDIIKDQVKPVDLRQNSAVYNQLTGQYMLNYSAIDPKDGSKHNYLATIAPGTATPQITDMGMTELSPAQKTQQERGAAADQTDREEVIAQAQEAANQQASIDVMRNNASQIIGGTGEWAPYRVTAQKIALALGDKDVANSVGNAESFVKNEGQLTRQAVRETSSKAAVQEFKLIGDTLPTIETSGQGLNMVLGEYSGFNDYKQAKLQAQSQWAQRPGSTGPYDNTGFESYWNNTVSPYTFIWNRMGAPERTAITNKLLQSAEGRKELSALNRQLSWATDNGYIR